MERNTRHYDITNPSQAFQFVSDLLRLACHSKRLSEVFNMKKATLFKSLSLETHEPWSKLSQIPRNDEQGGKSGAAQQAELEQVDEQDT